jgi:capsid assembly protease
MSLIAKVRSHIWCITEEMMDVVESIALRENETVEAVAAKLGRPLDNARSVSVRNQIAIIPIDGVLAPKMDLLTEISGGASVETIARDYSQAIDDSQIKGVLLNFSTPGGAVDDIGQFARMIRAGSEKKPVWAYGGSLIASAGCWLAAAAGRVVVAPECLIGSIGVVYQGTDTTEADVKKGVKREMVVARQSPKKRPSLSSEAGRQQIQDRVNRTCDMFIEAVASYRGVTPEQVESDFGQGDLLFGTDAVAVGLADETDDFESTLAKLSEAADQSRRTSVSMTGLAVESLTEETTMSQLPTGSAADPMAELQKKFEALQKANTQLQADKIDGAVTAFVTRMTHVEKRFTPALAEAFRPVILSAMTDDGLLAIASGPSRLAMIEAVCLSLPRTKLNQQVVADNPQDEEAITEALDAAGARVLESSRAPKKDDEDKPLTAEQALAAIEKNDPQFAEQARRRRLALNGKN